MKSVVWTTVGLVLYIGIAHTSAAVVLPRVALVPAPLISLPGGVDSNSPVIWDLEDGQRKIFVMT